jgi:heme exporter protein CcmD
MDHIGFILGSYLAAFGGIAVLVWQVLRRGKALARQLPDEDKPWT